MDLNVHTWGRGPTVLCVHGLLHSGRRWSDVAALLRRRRVVAPDLPGFGASPPLADPSLDAIVDVVREQIAVLRPRAVMADSMGAIATIRALDAMDWPVRRLVLSGVPADGLPRLGRLAPALRWALATGRRLPSNVHGAVVKILARRATVHDPTRIDERIPGDTRAAHPRTAAALLRDLRRVRLDVHPPRTRAVVIRGAADRLVTAAAARHLADLMGCDVVEVPGAGHTPMVERPEAYAQAARKIV